MFLVTFSIVLLINYSFQIFFFELSPDFQQLNNLYLAEIFILAKFRLFYIFR